MEKIEAPGDADQQNQIPLSPAPAQRPEGRYPRKTSTTPTAQNIVYSGIDFQAERGQRIVLVGPNGAGKSTLLKLLAGVIHPQHGIRELGHNTRAGYYSQYRVDMLQPARTVLEEALDTPERMTEESIRTLLGAFLFRGDDVFKNVSVLSGGEKSRLALVKLLLHPPNLLLMDEPTTHLDMASIDALSARLSQFTGTLVFISHDVYFIREISNHVVRVDAGPADPLSRRLSILFGQNGRRLPRIRGRAGRRGPRRRTRPPSPPARSKSALKPNSARLFPPAARTQPALVAKLEAEILQLETRQKELTADLENP